MDSFKPYLDFTGAYLLDIAHLCSPSHTDFLFARFLGWGHRVDRRQDAQASLCLQV